MTATETTIKDLPIYCFHGSPGTPDDFLELERELSGATLVRLVRAGYPDDQTGAVHQGADIYKDKPGIFCGYSWGSVACLRDAAQHPDVKAVILIAPYLYPSPSGWLKKAVVGAPLLGKALLKKKGHQIVEELLEKTAHPCPVPESYRALAPRLAHPDLLQLAVQEKDRPGMSVDEAARVLKEREVPIACLWGEQDQTSSEAEQIAPLRTLVPGLFEHQFRQAGHAMLWTHPAELAAQIRDFLAGVAA